MDILDQACELEQKQTAMALTNHFKANKAKFVVSQKFCISCDAEIPEARQKAIQGCQYCVYCQQIEEKRGR